MTKDLSSEKNLNWVIKEIEKTGETISEIFNSIPANQKIILTQHPNLSAFAEAFNLEVAGSILESPEAESARSFSSKIFSFINYYKK
jgi:ABC-type Zn uptake system ZnuABC Zn-binding protein ZnuA